METIQKKFGVLEVAIVILALATAIVHFTLMFPDLMFILNSIGYLTLTAALFLPLPYVKDNRRIVRIIFIGYTLLTILLYFVMNGEQSLRGYSDKAVEVALVVLLWIDRR